MTPEKGEKTETIERLLRQIIGEIREVKAMLSQLGPIEVKTTLDQEVAAVKAQGGDVLQYLHERGKRLPRRKTVKKTKR